MNFFNFYLIGQSASDHNLVLRSELDRPFSETLSILLNGRVTGGAQTTLESLTSISKYFNQASEGAQTHLESLTSSSKYFNKASVGHKTRLKS